MCPDFLSFSNPKDGEVCNLKIAGPADTGGVRSVLQLACHTSTRLSPANSVDIEALWRDAWCMDVEQCIDFEKMVWPRMLI